MKGHVILPTTKSSMEMAARPLQILDKLHLWIICEQSGPSMVRWKALIEILSCCLPSSDVLVKII